jgi:hypothetical protein
MEAKEKALALFEKFGVYDFHPENVGNGWVKNIEESKKMALKVVDELIKQEQHHKHNLWVKYFEEVKAEIENINREKYSLHYAY